MAYSQMARPQVPSDRRVVTLVAPEKDEPESFHVDHAWRLRLSGPGAAQVNPLRLGALLLDRGIIPSKKAWDESTFYQLGNPLERFVAFPDVHRQQVKFAHMVKRMTCHSTQTTPRGWVECRSRR